MTQKELQNRLSVKAGSVSELVMKLENKSLVIRQKDPSDRRRIILSLTEKGENPALSPSKKYSDVLHFDNLSSEYKEILIALLRKMLRE